MESAAVVAIMAKETREFFDREKNVTLSGLAVAPAGGND
jgi:hypothetical protein